MIQRTFRHIRGIGPKYERLLWDAGILTWEDVFRTTESSPIPIHLWTKLQEELPHLKRAFAERNLLALQKIIPPKLQWRLIPNFWEEIAYLDIETTGYKPPASYITTIGVYDGKKIHNFTRHENLDEFPEFIRQFPAIATFYGKGFDIPFIQREMKIDFPQIHFDICFLLKPLGYKGGLKQIEKQFGIERGDAEGIDGSMAVRLWSQYLQTKDPRYLNTLRAYNSEDVVNLEFLLATAYNGLAKKEQMPFPHIEISEKEIDRPFRSDPNIVRQFLN